MIVKYLSQCFSDFHIPLADIHTHILKELSKSTKQGCDSVPVQQRSNLALTSTADQDGAWQQFPSDECLWNRWCRHGVHGSVTIHFAISERFHRLWIYMWKHPDANMQSACFFPNPHYKLLLILATRLHLHSTALYRKQSKVGRVSHGWEELNSSTVVIR